MSSSSNLFSQPLESASHERQPHQQAVSPPDLSTENSVDSDAVTPALHPPAKFPGRTPLVAPTSMMQSQADSTSSVSSVSGDSQSSQAIAMRQQPIPPPSEPMQYRAIGLIQGQYTASEEQFTRGTLRAADGTEIDAVLLGRVMSLVKKHLDLTQEHLWVVYPRTREKENDLHAQIVGVWEPEKLGPIESSDSTSTESADASTTAPEMDQDEADLPAVQDGYFSIRGEVVFHSPEQEQVVIKIQQSARKEDGEDKFFKLQLKGSLGEKALGHFWDLQVQRQEHNLVIQSATSIGIMPPRKRKKTQLPRRGYAAPRPNRESQRPAQRPGVKLPSKEPLPKPIKRRDGESRTS